MTSGADASPTPARAEIECCHRCLGILRRNDAAHQEELFGLAVWTCDDQQACNERLEEERAEHQREIARRLGGKYARAHYGHLIVMQDRFGHRYGYGNFYIYVPRGSDPEQMAGEKIASATPDERELLVYEILSIPDQEDTP